MTRFHLPLPDQYEFAATVHSHGWYQLAPFHWEEADQLLSYRGRQSQAVYGVQLRATPDNILHVHLEADSQASLDQERLMADLRWMLRLDEDMSLFYELCAAEPKLRQTAQAFGGRLLRSASVWEDVVKTLTTTNTTWSGTQRMCQRLTENWGEDGVFPTPAALAALDVDRLKKLGGLGYRAGYVQELAVRVASGQLDLEALKSSPFETKDLYKFLRGIKGVGDYAASSMMMLLGYYDFVPVDSIAHAMVSSAFYEGHPVTPAQIRACFARFGEYAGLAYWCWNFREAG